MQNGTVIGQNLRNIPLSNIPDRNNDDTYSLSTGFKFAPSDHSIILANILVPLSDGGLRASVIPTVGFSLDF
jgi:hypothetical protein